MKLVGLLSLDRVVSGADVASKKRALELASQLLASSQTDVSQSEIFDSLLGRERLGSTGLGGGVAIPHGRVAGLDQAVAAFIHLERGVDYDAIDQQPVDLVFALLVPQEATEEHLQILASLAEAFRKDGLKEALRNAASADELMVLLSADTEGQLGEVCTSAIQ